MYRIPTLILLCIIASSSYCLTVESSTCKKGCPLALGSYYVWPKSNITFMAQVLNCTTEDVLAYNPSVPDKDRVQSGTRVNVPYACDCINGTFLGQVFTYTTVRGDTYDMIAQFYYANLTTVDLLQKFNSFSPDTIPLGGLINVPVSCSCGDADVSKKYGLFLTYPLRTDENLTFITQMTNTTPSLLQMYNPNVNIKSGTGILFIPAKDKNGEYPAFALRYEIKALTVKIITCSRVFLNKICSSDVVPYLDALD